MSAGDFVFRFGKQIVAWGETDGIRLMDQINPLDVRRGVGDVYFENIIIPLWMTKAEYFPDIDVSWIQDLGLEFVVNPNAKFISDKTFATGNDEHGIWAVDVAGPAFVDMTAFGIPGVDYIPPAFISFLPPPLDAMAAGIPPTPSRIGSQDLLLHEPDEWDSDSYEYAFRLKTVIKDAFITLNYFYGRENAPVTRATNNMRIEPASDGLLILHPEMEGYYPRFRFAGVTFTRDFEKLNIKALGGVGPVLRLEAFYGFDNTFTTVGKANPLLLQRESFEKYDEIRYAIGIDWKIKLPLLNPRDSFNISPQFFHQHILDYPSNYGLMGTAGALEEDNYSTTLTIRTTYLHNKLSPMFYWQRDYQGSVTGDMFMARLAYEKSYHWIYTIQGIWLEGEGMDNRDHKDNVAVSVTYRF